MIVGGEFTVNAAGTLVTVPATFVTVTVNSDPLSPLAVAGVVYELDVAPAIAIPLLYH